MKGIIKFINIKAIWALIFILPFTLIFTGKLVSLVNFPDRIHIIEGSSQSLDFALPVNAVIEPDTVTALKINDSPVNGNVKINLNQSLTIESQEVGTANMTISILGVPVKRVLLDILPDSEVIPCGMTVGVEINTEGVMVLAVGAVEGDDGNSYNPSAGILKSGDVINAINGQKIDSIKAFTDLVEDSGEPINLTLIRKDETIEASVKPAKSAEDSKYKIGAWIRDSTQGIGTITYYNPSTNKFGALGHGILDVDTKQLMSVRTGVIKKSSIDSVKKGKKGAPGELVGDVSSGRVIGTVTSNSRFGIFGSAEPDEISRVSDGTIKVALQNQVHEGPAKILCNVEGNQIMEYDVYIETVNRYSSDDSKGMVVRITDPELLRITNGIVQGMSGSPIIQDERLIGAVTHVFVQDPAKGYGIFIENMMNSEN